MKTTTAVLLSLALLAACHSGDKAPPPLASIDLPAGADLKPYDSSKPPTASPTATAQLGGKVWLALGNLYLTKTSADPGGPGMLVGIVPSTGAKTVIDLGGSDGRQCQNPGAVKPDGGKLYVACGPFSTSTGLGVSEVDVNAGKVTRFVAAPAGFIPTALALTPTTIWVSDSNGANVMAIDRASFTAKAPQALPCANTSTNYYYVPSLLASGSDLFALCSATDGYLVRLDATTGAQKGDRVLVGQGPIAMVVAGDGRLAIVNSLDATLTMVTIAPGTLTADKGVLAFKNSSDLEDVKALGQFIYVMISGTQTVAKVDLSKQPPVVVDEVNVNPNGTAGADPNRLELLDDTSFVVSDFGLSKLIGGQFGPKTTK